MDDDAVMRVAREMGYSVEDVTEARQVMRGANVPEDRIASVLRLLAHAAALDGVESTLSELALRAANQAGKEEE
ncbi:MAG: hypothetical protein GTO22_08680 [Gemmatimonadales bacterium]|nr:hypothetical protein [Gemmatimonadales bacterium]